MFSKIYVLYLLPKANLGDVEDDEGQRANEALRATEVDGAHHRCVGERSVRTTYGRVVICFQRQQMRLLVINCFLRQPL